MLFITVCISFASCKGKSAKVSEPASNDTTKYFQVAEYIQSQVKEISSTPFFIYKLTTEGDKKDSTPITNAETSELAQQFTKPDLNDHSIKKYYIESVFFDETTKTFSINYSTTNKELELQNVDVILKEDGKTVKRIFLRKFLNYSDSSVIEQLSWKPNESFQIDRLVQLPSQQEVSRQTQVIWNVKG
ncbi:MAG TPA: hypothetical protein VF622_00810 [Segetibacter sp.]|jgi:hypothetical protein